MKNLFPLLRGNSFQPGRGRLARKLVASGEFIAGHDFQAEENVAPGDLPRLDLGITYRAVLQDEAVGFDLPPELFIAHRPEPFVHLIDPTEFFQHAAIVPDRRDGMQVVLRKRR